MKVILLVDDEESILDFMSYNLEKNGYRVTLARTGEEGIRKAGECDPDLVILDIMLPDMDGFEVCKALRSTLKVPILMLSVLDTETDKVLGLELGADDYMTKPFSIRELLARVKAVLRRSSLTREASVLEYSGHLRIDGEKRLCFVHDQVVNLTLKEYELLRYMVINAGLALSRAQIMEAVWGYDIPSGERTVDSHIKVLRRKLQDAGAEGLIETVRGIGYRLKEDSGG